MLDFIETNAERIAVGAFYLLFLLASGFFRRMERPRLHVAAAACEAAAAIWLFFLLLPAGIEVVLVAVLAMALLALL